MFQKPPMCHFGFDIGAVGDGQWLVPFNSREYSCRGTSIVLHHSL